MFAYNIIVRARKGAVSEVDIWESRVAAAGGTLGVNSLSIASDLIDALVAETYGEAVKYLLPLLGSNLAAARVPLRDSLGVGIAGNSGFVDGDFTEATGLANSTEAAKRLDTLINPSQLGAGNNGGIGFWEVNWGAGTGVEPMGMYTNLVTGNRAAIDMRTTQETFRWGAPANYTGILTTASNGHLYGQRSSATARKIYKDGTQSGSTNTTSDPGTDLQERTIYIMGVNHPSGTTYWKGRCAVAYMTDGTLSDSDASALHTLLGTYLITPTGR